MKKTALFSALSLIFLAPAYASSLPSVAHETFGDVYLFEQQLPNTLSTPKDHHFLSTANRVKMANNH